MTNNNYDSTCLFYNGDIGVIKEIHPNGMDVEIRGEILRIKRQMLNLVQLSYGMTIHKSQGSEYDNVYIMLPDKPLSLLTRNMVNTAISRARKCVTLITINDALAIAASNKCKRNRITRLEEKLKNMGEEECQKECQEHVE